jgi:hypothetical protein
LIEDDNNRNENWINAINNFDYTLFEREKLRLEVINNFSWDVIIKKYLEILK